MGSTVEKQGEASYYLIDENTNPIEASTKLTEFLLRSKKFPVVGLDTEWTQSRPPSFSGQPGPGGSRRATQIRNPVAILQLATKEGPTLLIRLGQIFTFKDYHAEWQTFFLQLKEFLNSTEVLKVGVAIQTDTSHLFYDYGLYTVNCLDLQHIAAHCGYPKSGLAYLSKRLCNVHLPKFYSVQRGDWDSPRLPPRSLKYAADDAKLAVLIFEKFMEQTIRETKNDPKPIKNCADFINLWRYKTDVIYRHYFRPRDDSDKKKTTEDITTTPPPAQPGSSKLLLACPQESAGDLVYRTYKDTESKPYSKVPFCVLILVVILIISLAVSLLFQLVQSRADYSI